MRLLLLSFFSVLLAFSFTTKIATAEEDSTSPISVEEISPCCTQAEIEDGVQAATAGEPRFVVHRNQFSEEEFRLMKERARIDPKVRQMKEDAAFLETSPAPGAPGIAKKFAGNTFVETFGFNGGLSFIPPDTIFAVGPNNLLEATNGLVRLSSKTNTNVQKIGLATFFKRSGKFIFDPKAYYDLNSGRFFVIALERDLGARTSTIRLAVSQSSNPTSLTTGWCSYGVNSKVKGSWADFPSFGMNQVWTAINVNNFNFSNGVYFKSFFRVFSTSNITNNSNSCPSVKVFTFARSDFNINPAQHYTNDSQALYAVVHFGPSNFYGLYTVSGTSKPTMSQRVLIQSQNPYFLPPDADQPGTNLNLNTGDNKILQLAYRSGILHAVQTTGCNFSGPPNESCVRLLRIDPSLPAIVFESDLGAGANKYLWNPSIAINKNGDVTVAMQMSGAKLPLSTSITGMKAAGSKLERLKMIMKGNCPILDFDGRRYRTGDYTGAHLDPADQISVWIAGEWALKGAQGCRWSTEIARTKY